MQKNSVTSACIGVFDGMHLGHQSLFEKLDQNGAIIVISRGNVSSLTPSTAREKYTNFPCFFYKLDEIRHLSGGEFIKLLTKDFTNLKKIIIGYDFKFGKNRSCNVDDLKELFEGEVLVLDELKSSGVGVHSSVIKNFIYNGDMINAQRLLGRRYCIEGRVISGQGIGAKELVATINFTTHNYILPKDGIYATFANVNGKIYKSVTFVGKRVSTDKQFSTETHIIQNFDQSGFDKIEVCFVKFIRENAKFDKLSALKEQILDDIKSANMILSE